jgi:hypothetical protein
MLVIANDKVPVSRSKCGYIACGELPTSSLREADRLVTIAICGSLLSIKPSSDCRRKCGNFRFSSIATSMSKVLPVNPVFLKSVIRGVVVGHIIVSGKYSLISIFP